MRHLHKFTVHPDPLGSRLVSKFCAHRAMATTVLVAGIRQWVTSKAMSFSSISCCVPLTSQHIFALCDRLKMNRIYTMANSAKMVNFILIRNQVHEKLINKSVSKVADVFPPNLNICTPFRFSIGRFPAWSAVVKIDGRDMNVMEYAREDVAVRRKFAILWLGHIVSCKLGNVIRSAECHFLPTFTILSPRGGLI